MDQFESDVRGIMKVNSLVRERFDAFDSLSSDSDSESDSESISGSEISELPEVILHEPLNIPEVLPIPPAAPEVTHVPVSATETPNEYLAVLDVANPHIFATDRKKHILHDLKYRYKWERYNGRKAGRTEVMLYVRQGGHGLYAWLEPKYGVALNGDVSNPHYLGVSWKSEIRNHIQLFGWCGTTRNSKYGVHSPSDCRRRSRFNEGGVIHFLKLDRDYAKQAGGKGNSAAWMWVDSQAELYNFMRHLTAPKNN